MARSESATVVELKRTSCYEVRLQSPPITLLLVTDRALASSPPGADGREAKNEHAVKVINRISDKLTGRDFKATVVLPVDAQVQKLIQQATSMENLCQCFIGWCAFW